MKFFNRPTQVKFLEPFVFEPSENCPAYTAGIAYEDKIICGCCGGIFEIEEIYNGCELEGWAPVVVFDDWADLSEEIFGD